MIVHGRACVVLAITCCFAIGCGEKLRLERIAPAVREALEDPEQLEIFSLEPIPVSDDTPQFHDWKVLGKLRIDKPTTRKQLGATLRDAMARDVSHVPSCFNPRHGIRLVKEGKTVDLVICFQCMQYQPFAAGVDPTFPLISAEPAPLLNQVLEDAGIALAAPPQ